MTPEQKLHRNLLTAQRIMGTNQNILLRIKTTMKKTDAARPIFAMISARWKDGEKLRRCIALHIAKGDAMDAEKAQDHLTEYEKFKEATACEIKMGKAFVA